MALHSVYTNRITLADSVWHAQSQYLIQSKHVLNQAILNHDRSHKTGVPVRFPNISSACIMDDSEAQQAII